MVNYGYGPNNPQWKEEKKWKLAEELRKLIIEMKLTRNDQIESGVMLHDYPEPYIEVDNLYEGVRIRKITALTDEQTEELVKRADQIFLSIMK